MTVRVLILRAGSGMGNNVIRSLRAGEPSVEIVGCHDDRFVLLKSPLEKNYALPTGPDRLVEALNQIVARERIDLLIPVNDADVYTISKIRKQLACRTFLPRHEVIETCQDKYALTMLLRKAGVPAPLTYRITSIDRIESVFRKLAPRKTLWCRIRGGTGSFGAIPVRNPDQVRSWIRYWEEMRGLRKGAFTLSEYLPGRDYYVQSLWKNGRMILTKMAERLAYLDNGSPSGVSSLSSLAKTVLEPQAIDVCVRAVKAAAPRANGVFFLDVKEDTEGVPNITEINAGRFTIGTNILDLTGRENMVAHYVRLAMGAEAKVEDRFDFEADRFAVRAIDTTTTLIRGSDLFEQVAECQGMNLLQLTGKNPNRITIPADGFVSS